MNPSPHYSSRILPVNFTKPRRKSYQRVDAKYHGLYSDPRTGKFYERPFVNGRQTWRLLSSSTPKAAHLELMGNRAKQKLARVGGARDPYLTQPGMTMTQLFDFYLTSNCPRRNQTMIRSGSALATEIKNVSNLRAWWQGRQFSAITLEDCRDYYQWRLGRITRGAIGHRQIDVELITLSNVFRWAMRNARKTGVRYNPIADERERFKDPRTVRHCRENQPSDATELHFIAARLFENPESEVLGWQYLFEAFCGSRTHEILRLRIDAKLPYHPGFIQCQQNKVITPKHIFSLTDLPELPRQAIAPGTPLLFLYDSQTSKGTFPFIPIHRALGELLTAFHAWHYRRYSENPWYFPGQKSGKTICAQSLAHALKRVAVSNGLPHRTSHGARSYFVNVLRSHGMADSEISLMIGQKTQGKLIVDVYGRIPTQPLDWLAGDGSRAWEIFPK